MGEKSNTPAISMNIYENILKGGFRTTADGTRIFFPYGAFGKGRIIDTEITYQNIIKHQTRWISIFGIVAATLIGCRLWRLFILCYSILCLINYMTTERLIKNLSISNERITLKDIRDNISKTSRALICFSMFTNILLIVTGVLFFFISASMFSSHHDLDLGILMSVLGISMIAMASFSISNSDCGKDRGSGLEK
jgi:hypothetical protein